jgi:hypothetical protein
MAVAPRKLPASNLPSYFANSFLDRGYVLWYTPLGGQVPCFSTLSSTLSPPPIPQSLITAISPTTATSSIPKPISAIVNIAYAIYYPVNPPASTLSTGTQAGIGAGAGIAGLAIVGLLAFFIIRKIRRRDKDRNTFTSGLESTGDTTIAASPAPYIVEKDSENPVVPVGGYYQQQIPQDTPQPAYQNWQPESDQHWQTAQGVYPSPPASASSPPPGAFGVDSRYTGQAYASEVHGGSVRHEIP